MLGTLESTKERIQEIDSMFEKATGWGSWMVMAANEREQLVTYANNRWGAAIEHKWQARLSNGRPTN